MIKCKICGKEMKFNDYVAYFLLKEIRSCAHVRLKHKRKQHTILEGEI